MNAFIRRVWQSVPWTWRVRFDELHMSIKGMVNKRFRCYLKNGYYRESYGDEYPQRTVMLLHRVDVMSGVFSDCSVFLRYFEYADKEGYDVVIDKKTSPAYTWGNIEEMENTNVWEYYFEQPSNLGLDDVQRYKNVLRYEINGKYGGNCFWKRVNPVEDCFSKEELLHWHNIAQKYIRVTDAIKQRVRVEYQKLIGKRVLGVAVREGYKVNGTAPGHPLQPPIETVIDDTKQFLGEWKCDCIFLSCETIETRNLFIEALGRDNVFFVDRIMRSDDVQTLPEYEQLKDRPVKVDMRERNESYICEMMVLSMCTSLLSIVSSGPEMVLILNGGAYEHVNLYQLGYAEKADERYLESVRGTTISISDV